ncbi:MAG: hypothetical protein H8E55_58755 [Pelagibacterales bacterium]|nr:hypothetical protein [Pelagibacterales bacterium]
MKKFLLLLLFPLISFGQEDIERFKVYETTNTYTSLLLDTANGQIWQLQIGLGKTSTEDRFKTVLSDFKYALSNDDITKSVASNFEYWEETYNSKPDSIVSIEDKKRLKPYTFEERLSLKFDNIELNGRFKLYPTGNMYNFIMVDVINGRSWQVQWSTKKDERLVLRIY